MAERLEDLPERRLRDPRQRGRRPGVTTPPTCSDSCLTCPGQAGRQPSSPRSPARRPPGPRSSRGSPPRSRAAARDPGTTRLVVGHGSGSFGHVAARRYGIAGGLRSAAQLPGVSLTQDRAAALHRQVIGALRRRRRPPLLHRAVELRGRRRRAGPSPSLASPCCWPSPGPAAGPLRRRGARPRAGRRHLLDRTALRAPRPHLPRTRFPRPPRPLAGRDGRRLRRRAAAPSPASRPPALRDAARSIGAPAGTDVTGGMLHRVETALALAARAIPSLLLNGLVPGVLERAFCRGG